MPRLTAKDTALVIAILWERVRLAPQPVPAEIDLLNRLRMRMADRAGTKRPPGIAPSGAGRAEPPPGP